MTDDPPKGRQQPLRTKRKSQDRKDESRAVLPFKDTSTAHRTQLETRVRVGRRSQRIVVCIPGRDVWAYQMARIELQNQTARARKELVAAQGGK